MKQSNKLLIDEYPLQVLPSLAVALGLHEAIFLQQLHYWLKKAGKERDGRVWVYNTYADWNKQFPYIAESTLRALIGRLRDAGIVETTSSYNQSKMDQTLWYTINYDNLPDTDAPSAKDWQVQQPTSGMTYKEAETTTENNKSPRLPANASRTAVLTKVMDRAGIMLTPLTSDMYHDLEAEVGLDNLVLAIEKSAENGKAQHFRYVEKVARGFMAENGKQEPVVEQPKRGYWLLDSQGNRTKRVEL